MEISIGNKEKINLEHLNEREKEILKEVNNVLYFADNSDYGTTLWEILFLLVPEIKEKVSCPTQLNYIEEEE